MEIGYIASDNLSLFANLLLPEAVNALTRGEPVTALGLTDMEIAVGAAAGVLKGQRFHLLSLYVAPDCRLRGGGRMLLEALCEAAEDFAAAISVDFTTTLPQHATLLPFLTAAGFAPQKSDNMIFAARIEDICKAQFFRSNQTAGGFPFTRMGAEALRMIGKKLVVKDLPMPEGGLNDARVDRDVSTMYLRGDAPTAYIVVCRAESDLELAAAWVGESSPTLVAELLRSAASRASQKYAPQTVIYLHTPNARTNAILRQLVPNAQSVSHSWLLTLR